MGTLSRKLAPVYLSTLLWSSLFGTYFALTDAQWARLVAGLFLGLGLAMFAVLVCLDLAGGGRTRRVSFEMSKAAFDALHRLKADAGLPDLAALLREACAFYAMHVEFKKTGGVAVVSYKGGEAEVVLSDNPNHRREDRFVTLN